MKRLSGRLDRFVEESQVILGLAKLAEAGRERESGRLAGNRKQPMRGILRLLRLLVSRRADPSVSTSRLHGTTCQCGLSLCVLVALV